MSISSVDLSTVPVVDNHAHPLTLEQPRDTESFRRAFSEARSSLLAREHVATAVSYRWSLHQLGTALGVPASEEAILQRRSSVTFADYAGDLVKRANLAYLLLDEGYPPPAESYSTTQMEEMLGIQIGRLLRLETLVQDLSARHHSFAAVVDAFDSVVSRAREAGYVGLKSIMAYRTGLAIESVSEKDAAEAFEPVRVQAQERGHVRLTSKPLIDFFVWRAVRHASTQHLPIQFHTGYGDPDLDLRLANPLHLRSLFEDERLSDVPIILLHESYPYTAEAAYLAVAYPNAYLDLAFTLPPLDRSQLRRAVEIALGVAPASKLLVSSDGVGIPEHYWLGAIRAREIVGEVLGEMVAMDELRVDEAEGLGHRVLYENALRVYGLVDPGEPWDHLR